MPSSEKLKIGDVPKFPYVATKRPLYYTERKDKMTTKSFQSIVDNDSTFYERLQ